MMIVYQKNLYYTQKVQKKAQNIDVKPQSYTLIDKVWSNSKDIKTKRN